MAHPVRQAPLPAVSCNDGPLMRVCFPTRLYCSFLVFNFGFSTPSYYLSSYLQAVGGATAGQGATVTALTSTGNILGRITLGFLADRGV